MHNIFGGGGPQGRDAPSFFSNLTRTLTLTLSGRLYIQLSNIHNKKITRAYIRPTGSKTMSNCKVPFFHQKHMTNQIYLESTEKIMKIWREIFREKNITDQMTLCILGKKYSIKIY